MTIELTANDIDCVSYEGFPLSIHMVMSPSEPGKWRDRNGDLANFNPHPWFRNHYDCNLRHAFVTLNKMGCEVRQLRIVIE